MLDFRLDTFLAVCAYESYTKAADKLNITQPAVSQHIRWMERYYGVKLFVQEGKRMILTAAGRMVRDAAITFQHDDIFLKKKLGELPDRHELVFGATLTIGEFVAPDAVLRYLRTHPETAIKMTVANTQELLKKLNRGEIDFALVEGYFAKNEYDALTYAKERYIAVCSPVYECKPYSIEDLFSERLIVREAGAGTREILERYLEERNLHLADFKHVTEMSNTGTIKALVRGGGGIAFLYAAAVQKELDAGELRQLPLRDFPMEHEFTFIWRANSVFSDEYRRLFDELRGSGEADA